MEADVACPRLDDTAVKAKFDLAAWIHGGGRAQQDMSQQGIRDAAKQFVATIRHGHHFEGKITNVHAVTIVSAG